MFSPNLLVRSYSRILCRSDCRFAGLSKGQDFLKFSRLLFQQMPKTYSTDDGEEYIDKPISVYKYFLNLKMPLITSSNPLMKEAVAKAAVRLEWVNLSDDKKKEIKDQYNVAFNIKEEPIEESIPKNAYQAFCKEFRPLLTTNDKPVPLGTMSKMLSAKYKTLSDKEKEKYLAFQPVVVPGEKAPPRNTWEAFCRVQRPLLLAEVSDRSIGFISKQLSERYRALTDEEREQYKVYTEEEEEEPKELPPPKSAFHAFCREQRPLVKPTLPKDCSSGEMLKQLAAKWKLLSEDDKKKYEVTREPKPPKRVTAYSAYMVDKWHKMKAENPNVDFSSVSKASSQAWHTMPEFEKEIYRKQHEEKMLAAGVPPKEVKVKAVSPEAPPQEKSVEAAAVKVEKKKKAPVAAVAPPPVAPVAVGAKKSVKATKKASVPKGGVV